MFRYIAFLYALAFLIDVRIVSSSWIGISNNDNAYCTCTNMSVERKNPLKRDQALNDATSGQIGDEPRSVPEQQNNDLKNEQMKTARKMSRDIQ